MGQFKPYQFSLPTLPGPTYDRLKSLGKQLGLTQWQVVILALETLETVVKDAPAWTEAHKQVVAKLSPWEQRKPKVRREVSLASLDRG